MNKICTDCESIHWTDKHRCPACHGVWVYHRERLQNMYGFGEYFSQEIFEKVYGRE